MRAVNWAKANLFNGIWNSILTLVVAALIARGLWDVVQWGLIDAVWPFVVWFTEGIFREDKDIVEFEQRAYEAQGADWNNEVFPALKDLRAVLARCGVSPIA